MGAIAEAIYHIMERVDGEKSPLRWIGYKKAQCIKVWLMNFIR